MGGELFFFCAFARELALEPLEGVHVRVLVGVIMVGGAVGKERASAWLAIRRSARAVLDGSGREWTGRRLGGHGRLPTGRVVFYD